MSLDSSDLVQQGYRALARHERAPRPHGLDELRGLPAVLASAGLGAYGLWRRDRWGVGCVGVAVGLGLWFFKANDLTSARAVKRALWHTGATTETTIKAFVTIDRPLSEVYAFFRALSPLQAASGYVDRIVVYDAVRSSWWARLPGTDVQLYWDAEIVDAQEDRWILWRTLASGEITHEGLLSFESRADGRTEVQVRVIAAPPGGERAVDLLRYFDLLPERALADDLARIQEYLEAGPRPVLAPSF